MRNLILLSFIGLLALASSSDQQVVGAPELATAKAAADVETEPTRDTETSSRVISAITTTTDTADTTEDQDGPTTTVDSLGVNLDESSSAIINGSNSNSNINNSTNDDDSSGGAGESDDDSSADVEGIQPKSIAGAQGAGNSLEADSAELKLEDDRRPPGKPANSSRLNMTQVDEYFNAHKDVEQTVESWQRMSKQLKKTMGGIIGSMIPYALNMSQEAKISSNCSGAILKWVLSMNQLKSWALRMLDASGKPIAGLLEGSLTMFGNYRQCLKIRAPDDDEIEFAGEFREFFRGKYCIVQAKPWLPQKDRFYNLNTKLKALTELYAGDEGEPTPFYERTALDELSEWALAFNFVSIRMDICVPSMCSREDIQKAINFLLKGVDLKARVLRCELDPSADSPGEFRVAAAVESSESDIGLAPVSAWTQVGWLLVPASAVCLVILASAITLASSSSGSTGKQLIWPLNKRLNHTIKSLSLKRSVSSHLSVDYNQLADDKPLALYGLRFVLVIWVILVESAVNLKFEYLRELLMLKDLIFYWPMQVVINSSLQFDSIILLTAFTMSYKNTLNESASGVKSVTKFVLDKYVRLMPSIMVMVALSILLPLAYRGPVWNDYVIKQSNVCQSTGWLNAVFLQNYLPYKEICLPQTWLICVELQLVLLMAPIVHYLNKSYLNNLHPNGRNSKRCANPNRPLYWLRTAPGGFLLACIAFGLTSSFYNVYANDLPPSWLYTMADPDSKAIYFSQHLMRLWTHLAVFAVGIIAGVECRRASRNVLCNANNTNKRSFFPFNINLSGPTTEGRSNLKKEHSSSTSLPTCFSSSSNQSLTGKTSSDLISNSNGGSSVTINIISSSLNGSAESIDQVQDNTNGTLVGPNGGRANSDEANLRLDGRQTDSKAAGACACFSLLDIIGCLLAITTMTLIIFSTHDWSLNDLPKPLVAGLFDAGSRLVWSMALIWILYMVSVPHSSTRNLSALARLLGCPLMVSLGKLSFLIYIIHPFVHTTVLAIQEQPIYSSWLMLFHVLIGNMTITVILASLVSLFIEMPCRNLFRRCGSSLLLTQAATHGPTNCLAGATRGPKDNGNPSG